MLANKLILLTTLHLYPGFQKDKLAPNSVIRFDYYFEIITVELGDNFLKRILFIYILYGDILGNLWILTF